MAQLNFDATQVSPDTGYELIPAGHYNAVIEASEMKPTRDGSGAYLELTFRVIDGEHVNRKVFARLNLNNKSQEAVDIAQRQLSAIAHAVNVLHVSTSEQLHGIPLKIKVKIRKDKTGEYEDQNEIVSYSAIDQPQQGFQQTFTQGNPGLPPQMMQPQQQMPPAMMPPQMQQGGFPTQPWNQQQPPQQAPQAPAQQQPPQQAPQAPAQQQWAQQAAQPPQQQWAQQAAQPPQQASQQPQQAQPAWAQQQVPAQAEQQAQAPQQQQTQAPDPQQQHPAQAAVPPWQQNQG